MSWKYNLAVGGLLRLAFNSLCLLDPGLKAQEFRCCVFVIFLFTSASTRSAVITSRSYPVCVFRLVEAFLCLTVLFSSVAFVVDAFNQH